MNKIHILGTGTSTGVPILGCHCPVCLSTHSKDQRYRTSALIETSQGKHLLIDTTPDMRSQLLKLRPSHIDGAIITHEHADHLHGLDDLRPFCFFPKPHIIPIFTSPQCAEVMTTRFSYIFEWQKFYDEAHPPTGGGIPRLEFDLIQMPKKNFDIIIEKKIFDETFFFFLMPHGYGETLGFVHNTMGYVTDCHYISNFIINFLHSKNLELLIIECVQKDPHESHLTEVNCFDYIKKIAPKQAGLVHINHQYSHEDLEFLCSKHRNLNVNPLFDGQVLFYDCAK